MVVVSLTRWRKGQNRERERKKNGRERNDEYELLSLSIHVQLYTSITFPLFLSFHTISKLCVHVVCGHRGERARVREKIVGKKKNRRVDGLRY